MLYTSKKFDIQYHIQSYRVLIIVRSISILPGVKGSVVSSRGPFTSSKQWSLYTTTLNLHWVRVGRVVMSYDRPGRSWIIWKVVCVPQRLYSAYLIPVTRGSLEPAAVQLTLTRPGCTVGAALNIGGGLGHPVE